MTNAAEPTQHSPSAAGWRFALTIFLGAFLLFQVQPVIGKVILPWFGGGSFVWITCLLFFQVALLVGYAYAHFVASRGRGGAYIHLGLLAASLVFLPIGPDPTTWKTGATAPVGSILLLLTANVGAPYVLLSATGPLVQSWFSGARPGASPYRLYALSNAGSLIALLSYPVLVEPLVGSSTQMGVWSVVYVVFVAICAWCALGAARVQRAVTEPAAVPHAPAAARPTIRTVLLWVALAASASSLLLAVTNQLCQDVAVVPFLWVVPLSLYLVSFIVCFDRERWYDRRVFGTLLVLGAPAVCHALHEGLALDLRLQAAALLATLFAACMICHGELVRAKPAPRHLTLFYLAVAGGGALGGVFVALLAPVLFRGLWELHLSLYACCILAVVCWFTSERRRLGCIRRLWLWIPLVVGVTALAFSLVVHMYALGRGVIASSRNFYGVLRVIERSGPTLGRTRRLMHGRINHGLQFMDEERRRWPTTYFTEPSGVGLALRLHPKRAAGPLRVGVVGLGTGTLAAYGRPGDEYRFYEINPDVERLARVHFTFLEDSEADIEVVRGDARVRMEEEVAAGGTGRYDVLAVDAFSGDSIPVHLLTLECAEIYWKLLANDGLLLLHISNRYLDLEPVVRALACETGAASVRVLSGRKSSKARSKARWMILAKDNDAFLMDARVLDASAGWNPEGPRLLWTDDYAPLLPIFNIR